ncbi:signal peptide peptidase SppA [Devosia rhodophyticola]|uniref:Signal peptide peptidase SppA n=1 Tax=Devosia rhodophyticola TaxID=3026423 RepID=A0ABY7Z0Q6_9HYPH|nr:signal peptide peptidase SppA [Devosia rhodophyticola]WDR07169.1 signal peptide peptidase SppA [Devosia rhodophyticola]
MTDQSSSDPHAILAADKFRRSAGFWRLLTFMVVALLILALVGRFVWSNSPVTDHIARVVVDGTIATNPARLKVLTELGENDAVKAVIVSINSPGGTTAGGEELYEALGVLRAQKPVVAVINELGASAAYMTAIATDRIFARRLSIVASIGVLFQHVNAGKLLDTIGVDLDKIASGPLKAEPDFDEAMTPEVRRSLGALVNDSFEWFVDIVAERRNLSRPIALALADGRIMTGRMGVETKLIDAIGGEAEAIEWLEKEKNIGEKLPVSTAFPPADEGFGWLGKLIGGQARAALGLSGSSTIALDGLVSLWQVDAAR